MAADGSAGRATDWADTHGSQLIGTSFAEAERAVTEAGLAVKAVRPPGITTLEFRTDRVTLLLDDADRVKAAHAG
jgi:hypothetical protein